MRVLIYSKKLKTVEKSGVGRAMSMQIEAMRNSHIDITTDERDPYDVVHINTVFPSDFMMSIKAKMSGKKVVYHAHSTKEDFCQSFVGSNLMAPFFQWWIMRCYSTGDLILTPTDYSKHLLQSYGINKPIMAISNGVDTSLFKKNEEAGRQFREMYGYEEDEKIVMSVGLYFKRKGIIDFVKLAKSMPEYQFIWFGSTPTWMITKDVKNALEYQLPNLRFAGYVSKEELKMAYSGSDLFLFPSYEETEGIVVLEALASEIPIVLRDIPVYASWLDDGREVYKAKDARDFKEKIRGVLEKKLPNLTKAGLKTAKSRDLRRQTELLKTEYERLCLSGA